MIRKFYNNKIKILSESEDAELGGAPVSGVTLVDIHDSCHWRPNQNSFWAKHSTIDTVTTQSSNKNGVSRVFTKIKKKLGKVNLRKGANLCLLLQPPEEFLEPLNGPRGRP